MWEREPIVGAAYRCLLEQQWHTFPVEPACFQLPCLVISYQEYAQWAGISPAVFLDDGYDGFSIIGLREQPLLLYNAQAAVCRQRFTVAHEVGHLLLRHRTRGQRQEDEANLFASVLLLPDAVLDALSRRGVRLTETFLMRVFGVSRAVARQKRRVLLIPPLSHPLDAQIEALFYPALQRLAPIQGADFSKLHDRYLEPDR